MNEDDIIRIQVEQLDKEKRELSVKMKTQEKRVCLSVYFVCPVYPTLLLHSVYSFSWVKHDCICYACVYMLAIQLRCYITTVIDD